MPIDREELRKFPGLDDISIPASYPLTLAQVKKARHHAAEPTDTLPFADTRVSYFRSEFAD
ncbi:hypothetical protein ABZU76_38360 [Amycolatopsis sp. NPDC005232]|uniref:hypothetical protein n=1 Tax=Amycolatopsis sp. NPDC005232 TaxID=3157027 RepID=UPI0033A9A4AE